MSPCSSHPQLLFFSAGLPESALVPLRPGAADPLHRHHPHPLRGHLSGCPAPDGHERLLKHPHEPPGEGQGSEQRVEP